MSAIEAKHRDKGSVHLVNRLHFQVSCAEQEQAFALRQNFAQTLQPEIVEIIDEVCSEYVSEHEWLRIEKLDLDLGRFSPTGFTRDFAVAFRDQFGKELAKQLGVFSDERRHESKQHSGLELFCHFMQLGTLPWWAHEADVEINAIALALCIQMPASLRTFFYQQKLNRSVWTRAALQLDDAAKSAIIALFSELREAETRLIQWIETSQMNDIRFDEPVKMLESVRHALLLSAPEVIDNQHYEAVIAVVFGKVIDAASADWLESMVQLAKVALGERQTIKRGASLEALISEVASEQSPPDTRQKQNDSRDLSFYADTEMGMEQRYVVHHAGVILLAPFFRKFFDACGLLDGPEWKSKDSQYQAVHLLKYLTTGSKKTPEYSLTLEKLICGIAIEEPIPLDVGLEEQQMDQAHELLASVIEHWQALKNTSVDGLRGAFLRRDGLITRKNDDWLLQVERKTLDVLLDSIPWGYSTITLPWNGYLIHVEW
jgi:Contractile injection system tape measure protein